MFAMVELWKASRISKKEFCEQHRLAKSVFYYWLKKYRQLAESEENGFIPVKLNGFGENTLKGMEIQYPNGVRVILPGGADITMIRSLIDIL